MRRLKYCDHWIMGSILVLSIYGIIMIGSASAGKAAYEGVSFTLMNITKQFIFVVIGFLLMMFFRGKFHIRFIKRKLVLSYYWFMFILMIACLAFPSVNGSHAWIRLGGVMTIQPSEFMKLGLILIAAYYFVEVPKAIDSNPRRYGNKEEFIRYKRQKCLLEPWGLAFLSMINCAILQRDIGTTAIMLAIFTICFLVVPNPYYRKIQNILAVLCAIGVIGLLVGGKAISQLDLGVRVARFASWIDPMSDPYGASYQQLNGLIAFAKNGLFGAGLGNSTQKFGYIPEAYNDFITAIIFEECGIIGMLLLVIGPIGIIIWRLFYYASRIDDSKSRIILCGTASYFFFHLLLNLGGVSGLIPMTGVPLLCVSAGGSSTLCAFITLGFSQAIITSYNRRVQHDAFYARKN